MTTITWWSNRAIYERLYAWTPSDESTVMRSTQQPMVIHLRAKWVFINCNMHHNIIIAAHCTVIAPITVDRGFIRTLICLVASVVIILPTAS
jgi:hypothetical protein